MLKVAKKNLRPPALSDSPADTCVNNLKTKADILYEELKQVHPKETS